MDKPRSIFYECKLCGLVAKQSWVLKSHMRRKHGIERPLICDSSPRSFLKEYDWHYLMEDGEKPFKCCVCSERFISQISRNVHEDAHETINHKCKYCDLKFLYREEKQIHQKMVHQSNNEINFECKECSEIFCNADVFSHHRKQHVNHKIKCQISPLTNTKMNKYKVNEKNHPSKSNNQLIKYSNKVCSVCKKAFKLKSDVIRHFNKFHGNNKLEVFNYLCRHCEKRFSSKAALNQHLVSHLAEKKFQCNKCNYKAKCLKDLNIHKIQKHSRKDIYQCSYCVKSFPVRSFFANHINKHDNTQAFKCPFCAKSYVGSHSLKNHIDKIHVENKENVNKLGCLCGKFICETSMRQRVKYLNSINCASRKHNVSQNDEIELSYCFECKKCMTTFKNKQEFMQHRVGCKKISCFYCKITFINDAECQNHINFAHKDKLYHCLKCPQKFGSNINLISHSLTHHYKVEENSVHNEMETFDASSCFECFLCGKLCNSEIKLNIHIIVHNTQLWPVSLSVFPSMN